MRMFRAIATGLLTAALSVGGLSLVSSPAEAAKPKRILEEVDPTTQRTGSRTYLMTGTVTQPLTNGTVAPYANGKVKVQRKTCKACKFKTIRTITTGTKGKYRTTIRRPAKGRYWWRVVVPGNATYAVTNGQTWVVGTR
ncbi:MAG: hypothetical protein ACI379_05295 [Nocardioides sp.]|uniref:hypothetical protein n=1 Tax=Nocardioides sp. TaxID=35761 RepID=UPI003F07177A